MDRVSIIVFTGKQRDTASAGVPGRFSRASQPLLYRWAPSRRTIVLMQFAAPHQTRGDVGRLQRRAFGR